MKSNRAFRFVLVLAAAASCQPDDQRTDTMDPIEAMRSRENLPVEIQALLDSGSVAF